MPEKAHPWAFFLLKAPSIAFRIKNLLRFYAVSVDVEIGTIAHKYQNRWVDSRVFANQAADLSKVHDKDLYKGPPPPGALELSEGLLPVFLTDAGQDGSGEKRGTGVQIQREGRREAQNSMQREGRWEVVCHRHLDYWSIIILTGKWVQSIVKCLRKYE